MNNTFCINFNINKTQIDKELKNDSSGVFKLLNAIFN
ncbi:hypothetical protein HNQ02_001350 [Flavobacterium sp. 7E]|nr:hypothetical protein [Flavobacterium sp. 7E]